MKNLIIISLVIVVLICGVVLSANQGRESEKARKIYPPDVTREILSGNIPAPEGFDALFTEKLSKERLKALRSGSADVSGEDNDIAALCLAELKVSPDILVIAKQEPGTERDAKLKKPFSGQQRLSVKFIDSNYKIARGKTSGFFKTGQKADIALSAIDFNNTGGPLLFNHQAGIATDGTHLLVADSNNNRVLVWNKIPQENTAPDMVLGQKDFITNNPGTGRDGMNWPVNVATDGKRIIVADTYNDRLLIWNNFPSKSGTPADMVIQSKRRPGGEISKDNFYWPWGVWTNGGKLVMTSTRGGGILIWNKFPAKDGQPADILLKGNGKIGTPRTITSNGKFLIVGDHNSRIDKHSVGNFFWKTFPVSDDQPYDFFMADPAGGSPWMQGDVTDDGKLILLGKTMHIWNAFPENQDDKPDLSITGYDFRGGDHAGLVVVGKKLYLSLGNGNKIVVYNSIPTKPDQAPDFAIGSPDIDTDTLQTNFIISNPTPVSDGKSLFVSSDFDRKLYVWKNLPDQSGARPDIVYSLGDAPWDNALWENNLALAGKKTVYIWKKLPLKGELPDLTFDGKIGNVTFGELMGVAIDKKYFYLGDFQANKIYVWEGMPSKDSNPLFSLDVEKPKRLSSDGKYLAMADDTHVIKIYPLEKFSAQTKPVNIGGVGKFNLPMCATVACGYLFIADTGFNRVFAWKDIKDALSGKEADCILGKKDIMDIPEIGRDKLFWPGALCFDGNYLWVGEFKFSERLLRYSPEQ